MAFIVTILGFTIIAGIWALGQAQPPETAVSIENPTDVFDPSEEIGTTPTVERDAARTSEPTKYPPASTEQPTSVPSSTTLTAIELALAGVSSNADWEPYIQEFNGVQMALVPAGCFMMGNENGNSDEQPVREMCFDQPFWIDVYEVTNEQYGGAHGSWLSYSSDNNQPRIGVSWFESITYCESREARLPTEAEREYAARGPDELVYPWGNSFDGTLINFCDKNCDFVWAEKSVDDGYQYAAPVGSYLGGVSWVGAFDLGGNVWEWVNSLYMDYPYDPNDGREIIDYSNNNYRSIRGGSWYVSRSDARSAYRFKGYPSNSFYDLGFRCARDYTE